MKNQSKIKSLILSVGFVVVFIIVFMLLSQIKNLIPEKFERYSHGIIGTIAALGTVWVFLKFDNYLCRNKFYYVAYERHD